MRIFKILMLFALPLTLSNCASVLNGKHQKVQIQTSSSQSKVYVDGQHVGNGKTVTAKMKRDFNTRQIRVEKEGYKPEYKANFQQKKSPLYTLSIVPFGILLYPIIMDVGPKSFDYSKSIKVTNKTKLIPKEEDQKYLYLQTASFNVKKDKLAIKTARAKKYKKGKNTKVAAMNKEDINLDNTIFADAINHSLHKMGYVDTTNQLIKSKTNTLYLNADISALTIHSLTAKMNGYLIAEPTIEWEVTDIYGQEKYKTKMKQKSGEFAYGYSNIREQVTYSVKDAMDIALIKLLKNVEVQNLLNETDGDLKIKLDQLTISVPGEEINDLELATKATVTILNGQSHGSGFFISKDGYILTNYHVVAGTEKLKAILQDKTEVEATLIRHSEKDDLALLKVNANAPAAFKLPSGKNFKIGSEVFSIGTPASVELGQTLSKGIISAVRTQNNQNWIQTDVSINFGNSGGPLVNKSGELVGMVNSKIVGFGVEGIAFCIPGHEIATLLQLDIQ